MPAPFVPEGVVVIVALAAFKVKCGGWRRLFDEENGVSMATQKRERQGSRVELK